MGGRSVVITGAGRGIGRACAVRFAREGWRPVLVARTRAELEETARLAGVACDVVAGDVRDESVQAAAAGVGVPAALVYCAGVAPLLPIEQTTAEVAREVLDTNLTAAYGFARAVWPRMKSGGGAMVFISSLASRDPFVGFSAYAAAKAGVEGMVRALDREGKPSIRAYAVAPGAVETAMFRKLATPEQFPPERALRPEDVAEVVYQCACGGLAYSGGETIYLSRT